MTDGGGSGDGVADDVARASAIVCAVCARTVRRLVGALSGLASEDASVIVLAAHAVNAARSDGAGGDDGETAFALLGPCARHAVCLECWAHCATTCPWYTLGVGDDDLAPPPTVIRCPGAADCELVEVRGLLEAARVLRPNDAEVEAARVRIALLEDPRVELVACPGAGARPVLGVRPPTPRPQVAREPLEYFALPPPLLAPLGEEEEAVAEDGERSDVASDEGSASDENRDTSNLPRESELAHGGLTHAESARLSALARAAVHAAAASRRGCRGFAVVPFWRIWRAYDGALRAHCDECGLAFCAHCRTPWTPESDVSGCRVCATASPGVPEGREPGLGALHRAIPHPLFVPLRAADVLEAMRAVAEATGEAPVARAGDAHDMCSPFVLRECVGRELTDAAVRAAAGWSGGLLTDVCPLCRARLEHDGDCNALTHCDVTICCMCGFMSPVGEPIPLTHWDDDGGRCVRFRQSLPELACADACARGEGDCAVPGHAAGRALLQLRRRTLHVQLLRSEALRAAAAARIRRDARRLRVGSPLRR